MLKLTVVKKCIVYFQAFLALAMQDEVAVGGEISDSDQERHKAQRTRLFQEIVFIESCD